MNSINKLRITFLRKGDPRTNRKRELLLQRLIWIK